MRRATALFCSLVAALIGSGAAPAAAPPAAPVTRPNFLVFVADDMSWDDCGAYGNPAVRTPNIDRLAREGMRFDRAFLTASSCSPSRASILTGRYPHATGAPNLHQPLPPRQHLVTQSLRDAGYFTAAAGKWHLGPHAKQQVDVVLDKPPGPSGASQWLDVLRDRPKGKPFFLWLAAIDPHRPYDQNAPARHDPADVRVPPYLPDVPEVRKDLARYYDEIARLDDFVGKVLAELDAQKLAADTVVMFISDNGRPFPRKTTLYDDGIRTPLILRYPAKVKAGSVSASVVSTVDIAPTVLELAGVAAPATLQGRSFTKLLDDPAATVRDYAFAEHNWHDYQAYERGVRSGRFTYIRNWLPALTQSPPADAVVSPTFQAMRELHAAGKLPEHQRQAFLSPRPPEELYDVDADPHSLHNLALRPEHATTLAEMRRALDEWREQTADTLDPAKLMPDQFDRGSGQKLKMK